MDTTNSQSDAREQARWRTVLLGCVAVMATILVGWMLRATALVVVPVVFSIFLALLVAPLDRWGVKRAPDKLRWLGHVASMGAILLALIVFLGSVWLASQQVVERLPLESDESGLLSSLGAGSGDTPAQAASVSQQEGGSSTAEEETSGSLLSRLRDLFDTAGGSLTSRLGEWASSYATTVLSAAGTTLGAAVLVFFLTLMMLVEGPRWQKKIVNASRGPSRHETMEVVGLIAHRLRSYLWARTILGLATAILYVAWLWFFGIDLLLVWGLLAFFLNFVPTLGSLIAGILPVLYAFVQKDFGTAMIVGGGIFVIEQVMGNYVDPRVQGKHVSLSPLVILIALLFWGWIWGIAGAVLAVPVTITIAAISAQVPPLRPLALFLSNEVDPENIDSMVSRSGR